MLGQEQHLPYFSRHVKPEEKQIDFFFNFEKRRNFLKYDAMIPENNHYQLAQEIRNFFTLTKSTCGFQFQRYWIDLFSPEWNC